MRIKRLNYIAIDGKFYAFDINRLFDFISSNSENEPDVQMTNHMTYGITDNGDIEGEDLELVTKDCIETTNSVNKELMNLKYDFVQKLIDNFFISGITENGLPCDNIDFNNLTPKQVFCMNTLISEGILIEITNE